MLTLTVLVTTTTIFDSRDFDKSALKVTTVYVSMASVVTNHFSSLLFSAYVVKSLQSTMVDSGDYFYSTCNHVRVTFRQQGDVH